VRGEHWPAAFSPAVSQNVALLDDTSVTLPVQIEYAWSRVAVGLDGGYVFITHASDAYFVMIYTSLAVTDSLSLLAEFWTGRATLDDQETSGISLGFDWHTRAGVHLLAAGGPGVAWSGRQQTRWYGYLGLRWNIGLW
jgi:hypothetical protein